MKKYRNTIFSAVLFFAGFIALAQTPEEEPADSLRAIDIAVDAASEKFLSGKPRNVVVSVGVYDNGNTSVYDYNVKAGNIRLYEIGSVTKTMTGTLLAMAATQNKVKLNNDIRNYLPGSYPNLEYAGQPIRLYQLLNHSSGLPNTWASDPADGKVLSQKAFYKELHNVKLDTVPGFKLSYSNSAANLLAFILEKVYNKPFPELLKRKLFTPLKMDNTTFDTSGEFVLQGYDGEGKPAVPNQSNAAGGIRSTVPDMLNYIAYHLDEQNPVVELSHRPTWGNLLYYAMGLNWQMSHREGTERSVFQSGSTAGFTSYVIMYPDLKTGIVILTNMHSDNSEHELSEMGYGILGVLNAGDKR